MSYLFNKTTSGSLEQLGASIHRDPSHTFKTGVSTKDYSVSTPGTKGVALAAVAASVASTLPSIFNMLKAGKANSSSSQNAVQTETTKEVQSTKSANSTLESAMKEAKKSGNWSDVQGLISGSQAELQANEGEQNTLTTEISSSDDDIKSYNETITKDEETKRPDLKSKLSDATKSREAADKDVKDLAKQLDNPALTAVQKAALQEQYNTAVENAKTAKDNETAAKKAYDDNEDEIKATKVKLTQEENNNKVLKQDKAHLITVHDKLKSNIITAQQQVAKYTGKGPAADPKIDQKALNQTNEKMKKDAASRFSVNISV